MTITGANEHWGVGHSFTDASGSARLPREKKNRKKRVDGDEEKGGGNSSGGGGIKDRPTTLYSLEKLKKRTKIKFFFSFTSYLSQKKNINYLHIDIFINIYKNTFIYKI